MKCERCGEVNSAEIHTCTPQEPVAWQYHTSFYNSAKDDGMRLTYILGVAETNALPGTIKPLYTAPPQRQQRTYTLRKWQGLTDEEYEAMAEHYVTNCYFDTLKYARAIEAKLKAKNYDS